MQENKEKRKNEKPIPDNVLNYLNEDQQAKLRSIERFGWELSYIRRPLFQDPVVVAVNPNGKVIGTLELDGELNLKPAIETRLHSTAC